MDTLLDIEMEKLVGCTLTYESSTIQPGTGRRLGLSLTLVVRSVEQVAGQWHIKFEKAKYFSEARLESDSICIKPQDFKCVEPHEEDETLSFVRQGRESNAEITLAGLTHLAFAQL